MNAVNKKHSLTRITAIKSLRIGQCYIRATLDTRHEPKKGTLEYPLAITFFLSGDRRTLYYPLPFKMTRAEYEEVARATGKGRPKQGEQSPYLIKQQIIAEFDHVTDRLRKMAVREEIEYDTLRTLLKVKGCGSFVDIWQSVISDKSLGTQASYTTALHSYQKYIDSPRAVLSKGDIQKWVDGMNNDKLSDNTIAIYLRSAKVVWNEAVRKGLAEKDNCPFGKIKQGSPQWDISLGVNEMTELYLIFKERNYPHTWQERRRQKVHQALGLFLFQYLANGCNLADAASLQYNQNYFSSQGRMLSFFRQKTAGRSKRDIFIPLIAPLQQIIAEIGAEPKVGELILPQIYKGETEDIPKRSRVLQVNKDVREGMAVLAEHLGWTVRPGGKWARESFATNLSHAGVPAIYVSMAMGHAVTTVTSRYIDLFPLEKQMEYNSRLLNLAGTHATAAKTVTISAEEYRRLLQIAESQQAAKE